MDVSAPHGAVDPGPVEPEAHAVEGRNCGNSLKGTRQKTVITEIGPIQLAVPRDRDGTFEPDLPVDEIITRTIAG